MSKRTFALCLALLAIAGIANAGPIFDARILGVTAESNPMAWDGGAVAANLVNGSGIDWAAPAWLDYHDNDRMHMWHGYTPGGYWLQFTLPSVYNLTDVKVWNYGSTRSQSIKTVEILYSSNGSDWTSFGDHTFSQAGDVCYFEQVNLNNISAKYVKFLGTAATGYYTPDWVGCSEVAFYGQVPEPVTMSLLGLGALIVRRIRK